MCRSFCLIAFFLCSFYNALIAQVNPVLVTATAGVTNATYPSLALAINAINSGAVHYGTINCYVNAGYAETAPSGGYAITFSGTAANPVVFQKAGAGADPVFTASNVQVPGSITDAVFKIIGADYITIQNFTIQENSLNTLTTTASNNMTEWGIALLYASVTDGAQHNTFQNNTITLNRLYQNSYGIYSNTRHNATAPATLAEVTAASGSNSFNRVYANNISNVNTGIAFIGAGTNLVAIDNGNDVGGTAAATGNSVTNWGSGYENAGYISANNFEVFGIFFNQQINTNISFNTVISANIGNYYVSGIEQVFFVASPTTGTITGDINYNTVTWTSGNTASNSMYGIVYSNLTDTFSTININSNRVLNLTITDPVSSAYILGIANGSSAGTVNMNNNTLTGMVNAGTGAYYYAIWNLGHPQSVLTITGNHIGDALNNAYTQTSAAGGSVYAISSSNNSNNCALNISNNDIRGFVFGAGSSVDFFGINQSTVQGKGFTISNNTFTNLNLNTGGAVYLIYNIGTITSGGYTVFQNNKVVGSCARNSAGSYANFYGLYNNTNPLTAVSETISDNNFSNINTSIIPGGSVAAGIYYSGNTTARDVNIYNNTVNNFSTGAATAYGIYLNKLAGSAGVPNHVYNNTLSNFTATATAGTVAGFYCSNASYADLYNNSIATISSPGSTTNYGLSLNSNFYVNAYNNAIGGLSIDSSGNVSGVYIQQGTTVNVYKNKVYDLSGTNAASVVYGVNIAGLNPTTLNFYNNRISDLRCSSGSSTGALSVAGLYCGGAQGGTTENVYYNTVVLNAASSGANFYTAAVYQYSSGISTYGLLNLENNILVNNSTPSGTGYAVSFSRSDANFTNYGSASNGNLFYAGAPGFYNRIFTYGNSIFDQTLATFQARVATRDASSVSENPSFTTTLPANAGYLHIDPAVPSLAESNAVPASGYTDDVDGDIRNSTTPDIGADEFNGITITQILYTPLTAGICSASKTLVATIKDAAGIPVSGAGMPVLYYKINSGTYMPVSGVYLGANQFQYSFTPAAANNDLISYYIAAQNNGGRVTAYPSAGASAFTINPPAAAVAPTSPSYYYAFTTLNGIYAVGANPVSGQAGMFASLTEAVNVYNTICNISGPVTFQLTSTTYSNYPETYPLTINQNSFASPLNTLTIKPAAGINTIISGSVTSGALINLLNNYTTIDGSNNNSTSNNLTLSNIAVSGPREVLMGSVGTVPLLNVTLKNCIVINGYNANNAIELSSSPGFSTPGYFNNITIQNNNIQKAFTGIRVLGNTAAGNGSGLLIDGNVMTASGANSIRSAGINIQGIDGAAIVSNNRISNIANSIIGDQVVGISIGPSVTHTTVSGNQVSDISQTVNANAPFYGIWWQGPGVANLIDNNIISNLSSPVSNYTPAGIYCSSSNTNITKNIISSVINTGAAVHSNGILLASVTNSTVSGNTITGIVSSTAATAIGIDLYYGNSNISVFNNRISDIKNTNAAGYGANGIALVSSSGSTNTNVYNNFISDVAAYGNNTGAAQNSNGYGIIAVQGGGYNIDFNTVWMNTPQTVIGFSAAINIYGNITAAGAVKLRNNIFRNDNTTGPARVYAIYSNATSNTIFGAIDNNDYYSAGTNLGRFAAVDRPLLPDIIAGFGGNANSKNILPVFNSSTDLHLPASSNASLNNLGAAIAGYTADIDGETRNGLTPDMGADEFADPLKNYWVGKTSSVWSLPSNWEANAVPSLSSDAYITGKYTNDPVITGLPAQAVRNLFISGSGNLTLSNDTLQVAETITNSGGSFDASSGTVELKGTTLQTITGSVFKNRLLQNMIISNKSSLANIANDTLKISGNFSFGAVNNKTFITNGNLTLLSGATGTASLNDITNNNVNNGNFVAGDVTAERYIPATRKWRFLSVPVLTTQTVQSAWMEGATAIGQDPSPGYGTVITDEHAGAVAAGFDAQSLSGPSVKYYVPATNSYTGIATPSDLLSAQKSYFNYVRGNRLSSPSNSILSATVLRARGTLKQNNITYPVAANTIEAIGNPYASRIDLTRLTKTNMTAFVYVWDPNLPAANSIGGFQTLQLMGGNYLIMPGGGSYGALNSVMNTIESGQGFFMKGGSGSPSVQFTEPAKNIGSAAVFFTGSTDAVLFALLSENNNSTKILADAAKVQFSPEYSNDIDENDAPKLANTGANVSVKTGGRLLAIEAHGSIAAYDTIQLNISGASAANYEWNLAAGNIETPGIAAVFVDRFLHAEIVLNANDSNRYAFSISAAPASYSPDRFYIVFRPSAVLPVTFTDISAVRQADKTILVKWKTENEINIDHYTLQRSTNGTAFTDMGTTTATNNSGGSASYQQADYKPFAGDNYYGIVARSNNDQMQYSAIVKLSPIPQAPSITLFPNPVTNAIINLQFIDQPTGKYNVELVNNAGQILYTDYITISSSTESRTIKIKKQLAAGNYQLFLSDEQGKRSVLEVFVK